MPNRLAEHLTTWKAWYAVVATLVVPLGSMAAMLGSLVPSEDPATQNLVTSLFVPVQFVVIAFLAVGLLALASRRWPTTRDLGFEPRLTSRQLGLVILVFVVSHALFWLISLTEPEVPGQARTLFVQTGLNGPLVPAVAGIVSSVILAPVCEELLYRGAMLRPIHDALARRGRAGLGAVAGILFSSLAFALPHLGGSLTGAMAASYLLTGIAFGLVYVVTGSMTAAMVSHSLQSCFAFAQVLLFGRGDDYVSPILWIIVFGCPLWTYLCAKALHAVFPKGSNREGAAVANAGVPRQSPE